MAFQEAAKQAIQGSLRVRQGEEVLVVVDRDALPFGEAVAYWCKTAGASVNTFYMADAARPYSKPTKAFSDLISRADVTIYAIRSIAEEKPFRSFMVGEGRRAGRICMMPGFSEDMSDAVSVDYADMQQFTDRVQHYIKDAAEIAITNAKGTDIKFSLKGRQLEQDVGEINKKGQFGNLPAGEIFTAPVEESFSGTIAFDLIDEFRGPGKATFERGKLVKQIGTGIGKLLDVAGRDESAKMVGEFGIGTNRKARINSRMLEAEKAFGTVHFAIGDSYGFGVNRSKFHFDMLVDSPTILVNGRKLMVNGRFLFE